MPGVMNNFDGRSSVAFGAVPRSANGELLSRASGRYDAFVTMDRSTEHEQNVSTLPFGVLVLRAPSNRLVHLRPLAPAILSALTALRPGQLRHVGA